MFPLLAELASFALRAGASATRIAAKTAGSIAKTGAKAVRGKALKAVVAKIKNKKNSNTANANTSTADNSNQQDESGSDIEDTINKELESDDTSNTGNTSTNTLSNQSLNKLQAVLNLGNSLNDKEDNAVRTKADIRQEALARQKFRDQSISILKEIDDELSDDSQQTAEEPAESSKPSSSGHKSFISGAISGIHNKIKKTNKSDLLAIALLSIKQIWGMIQGLLGSIEQAGGFIPWISQNIPIWWNNINKLVQDKYGGWGAFIWEQIKQTAEMVLWISDKIGEFLLGKKWKVMIELLKLKFGLLMEWWDKTGKEFTAWWDRIQDIGITEYILNIIKDSTKEIASMILGDSSLKSLLSWWDEVHDRGGFVDYLSDKIQDWWEDFVLKLDFGYMLGIGDTIKKALLGGRSIQEVKRARMTRDELYVEKKKARGEEEQKKKEELDKKNKKYANTKNKIESDSLRTQSAMYSIAIKNYDKIENKYKTSANVNTSSNLIKKTNQSNRYSYTGKNSQQWMKVITSPFGAKESFREKGHSGVDFRAAIGTNITSITEGIVDKVYDADRDGHVVSIKGTDGTRTLYMHLSKSFVKVGDKISKGQLIAKSGNSGHTVEGKPLAPHIHIQVKKAGKNIDPLTYFNSLNYKSNNISVANNTNKSIGIKQSITSKNQKTQLVSNVDDINKLNRKIDEVRAKKVSHSLHETIRGAS